MTRDEVLRRVTVTPSECWVWLGHWGFGVIGPYRAVYEALVAPVPSGLELDHLCRDRRCVNPDHLEPVTHRENLLRSPLALAAINARKTHCIRGHEFTPENTLWRYPAGRQPRRECRTCASASKRRRARLRRERAA